MTAILNAYGQPTLSTVALLRITPAGTAESAECVVELHHTEPHHIKALLNEGILEIVYPQRSDSDPPWHAYVDGDGKAKGLVFNRVAHDLAALAGWGGWQQRDYLVGPVVFCGEDPADPTGEGNVPQALLTLGLQAQLWRLPDPVQGGFTLAGKCRFCAERIFNRPGQDWWEDASGFTRCMKTAGLIVGAAGRHSEVPGHQPMPAGLDGAPTTIPVTR